jgi:hypothetical protein
LELIRLLSIFTQLFRLIALEIPRLSARLDKTKTGQHQNTGRFHHSLPAVVKQVTK